MKVEVTFNKDTIKQWLREGQIEKGTVMTGTINYYAFELPSDENIRKIEFYTTVLQGDISLIVSQKIPYPTFDSFK